MCCVCYSVLCVVCVVCVCVYVCVCVCVRARVQIGRTMMFDSLLSLAERARQLF